MHQLQIYFDIVRCEPLHKILSPVTFMIFYPGIFIHNGRNIFGHWFFAARIFKRTCLHLCPILNEFGNRKSLLRPCKFWFYDEYTTWNISLLTLWIDSATIWSKWLCKVPNIILVSSKSLITRYLSFADTRTLKCFILAIDSTFFLLFIAHSIRIKVSIFSSCDNHDRVRCR